MTVIPASTVLRERVEHFQEGREWKLHFSRPYVKISEPKRIESIAKPNEERYGGQIRLETITWFLARRSRRITMKTWRLVHHRYERHRGIGRAIDSVAEIICRRAGVRLIHHLPWIRIKNVPHGGGIVHVLVLGRNLLFGTLPPAKEASRRRRRRWSGNCRDTSKNGAAARIRDSFPNYIRPFPSHVPKDNGLY